MGWWTKKREPAGGSVLFPGAIAPSLGDLAQEGSVLRERKQLLRYLHAAADGDAVAVIDYTAQAFWSPAALAEELAHDADLDILARFTMHALTRDDDSS